MRRFLALVLILTLGSCNGAPLSTQWKLRSFNVNTADLSQLRIALRAPDWATPTPERTVIEARYWLGDDEASASGVALKLRRGVRPEDAEELSRLGGAPSLIVYEIAPQSLGPAHALQLEALRLKTLGVTHGRIHISGAVACRRGAIPPGPISVDAFVHADDETGWLPLYEQHNVRSDVKDAEEEARLTQLIPACREKGGRRSASERGL
ncbi:MAG TPA: hypothetical protein VED87_04600 [Methylocystis sp.]|nr:hypothetical protein [Methylocystis sp.]